MGLGFIFYSSNAREEKEKHDHYQKALKEELLRSKKI
jgi:hypothetical protein